MVTPAWPAHHGFGIADFLSSFKGPHGSRDEIARNYLHGLHENIRLLFRLFFQAQFVHLFVPKHSPEGSQKVLKIMKIYKKHPPDLAWKSYLQKAPPKCENRILFKVLSLFPRVPGTPKSIATWTPNGPRNCKLWEKWVPKKTTKNKPLKSHQK